jgi:hypothetical protein
VTRIRREGEKMRLADSYAIAVLAMVIVPLSLQTIGPGSCDGLAFAAARHEATEPRVNVEWHVNAREADDLKKSFELVQPDSYETKNPVAIGLIVLVGSFVVPQIIEAFGDIWEKYRSDGFVLDARGEKLVIEKSARVPPGNVIVVSKDGVETVRVGGPNPDAKMLEDILDRFIKR